MRTFCLIFLFFTTSFCFGQSFKQQQLKYERVRTAFDEKWDELQKLIESKGIKPTEYKVFIRAFKLEKKLEVWISKLSEEHFVLLQTYQIAASSGRLGPKRKQGDLQVPEGFYRIDRFNPTSNFYISLGINYPNLSDKIIGRKNLGGDIFIHGSTVTIGCLPITDEHIKEVYALATQAKENGQGQIYVHIFPFEFPQLPEYKNNRHYTFWKNLEEGYNYFNQHKKLPYITVLPNGFYAFR